MQRKQKGFTLIELLVVIAIIGLLSTLAVVALTSARGKARDAKRISDIKQVQTALELYFADQGQAYPVQAVGTPLILGTGTGSVLCGGSTGGFKAALGDCGTTPSTYMGKVARDPLPGTSSAACTTASTAACEYGYTSANGTTYELWFRLENNTGELTKANNCASPNGIKSGATCP